MACRCLWRGGREGLSPGSQCKGVKGCTCRCIFTNFLTSTFYIRYYYSFSNYYYYYSYSYFHSWKRAHGRVILLLRHCWSLSTRNNDLELVFFRRGQRSPKFCTTDMFFTATIMRLCDCSSSSSLRLQIIFSPTDIHSWTLYISLKLMYNYTDGLASMFGSLEDYWMRW